MFGVGVVRRGSRARELEGRASVGISRMGLRSGCCLSHVGYGGERDMRYAVCCVRCSTEAPVPDQREEVMMDVGTGELAL